MVDDDVGLHSSLPSLNQIFTWGTCVWTITRNNRWRKAWLESACTVLPYSPFVGRVWDLSSARTIESRRRCLGKITPKRVWEMGDQTQRISAPKRTALAWKTVVKCAAEKTRLLDQQNRNSGRIPKSNGSSRLLSIQEVQLFVRNTTTRLSFIRLYRSFLSDWVRKRKNRKNDTTYRRTMGSNVQSLAEHDSKIGYRYVIKPCVK